MSTTTRRKAVGPRLRTKVITLRQAGEFIRRYHRHHGPTTGHKFSVGVCVIGSDHLVGVAVIGRPIAIAYDDGVTLEVLRTCTDGTRNANSALYGAAWRASKAIGATRAITYTQDGESGASLRAAGWRPVAVRRPRRGWNTPSRPRQDTHSTGIARTLWLIGQDLPDRHETSDQQADLRHETARPTHCRSCGAPLDRRRTGRVRATCSDICRARMSRARRRSVRQKDAAAQ